MDQLATHPARPAIPASATLDVFRRLLASASAAALLGGEKPLFGVGDRLEPGSGPALGGTPDLHASKRQGVHESDAPGRDTWIGQPCLEARHAFLGLDVHLPHVDQRHVLVGSASQLTISFLLGRGEPLDVLGFEEATHGDAHQIAGGIYND